MKIKIVFAFLNSFVLLILTYFWLNFPYTYDSESDILQFSAVVKNVILKAENKPSKEDFLFIDVSHDKMLVSQYDEFGFETGNIAVTDRQRLNQFLSACRQHPKYKAILFDIFLEDSTVHDSILQTHFAALPRLIIPYHLDGADSVKHSLFKTWEGLADYSADKGTFIKYQYIQADTCKTVPLELYSKLDGKTLNSWGPLFYADGKLALNASAISLPIRQFDIFKNDSTGYSCLYLHELVQLPAPLFNKLIENKIVVIGDFLDRDIHETVYGEMAGPLIQLNAYLSLKNGEHLLSYGLLLYIFIVYFIYIYIFVFNPSSTPFFEKLERSIWGSIASDFLKYAFIPILLTFSVYMIFDIQINVLILSIYILLVEYWRKLRTNNQVKNESTK